MALGFLKELGQTGTAGGLDPQSYAELVSRTNEQLNTAHPTWRQKEINQFFSLSCISDPVSLAFRIFWRFDSTSGLLADERYTNSALNYLNRIGESTRYELLKKFITQLKMLSQEMTYVFQEISGLEEIYKHKPWETFISDDLPVITVGTLETVDFKIQSLMSMYKTIWFDDARMCEVLPANLRRFDVSIFVYAMGAYQIQIDSSHSPNDSTNTSSMSEYLSQAIPNIHSGDGPKKITGNSAIDQQEFYIKAPDLYNNIVFDLSECEFTPWNSGAKFVAGAQNNNRDFVSNDIAFTYRFCKDRWRFFGQTGAEMFGAVFLAQIATDQNNGKKLGILDKYNNFKDKIFNNSFMKSNPFVQNLAQQIFDSTLGQYEETFTNLASKYGSLDALKKTGIGFVQGMAQNAVDKYTKMLMSKVNGMYLGNVYDWRVSNIIGTLGADNMAGAIANFAGNSKSSASLNSESRLPDGANVYHKM